MTGRTPNSELQPTDYLEVCPEDAERLQVEDGQRVRVRSRYGEALMPIRITSTLKPGELFATFHFADIFPNRMTSPHRDRYVKSPEYKVTAVRIEKEGTSLVERRLTHLSSALLCAGPNVRFDRARRSSTKWEANRKLKRALSARRSKLFGSVRLTATPRR